MEENLLASWKMEATISKVQSKAAQPNTDTARASPKCSLSYFSSSEASHL